jgi:D-arabinose 1-dehydrogenase-like Zn-dependent alcohol dehydrogenase
MRRQSTAQIVVSSDPAHFSPGSSSGCSDRGARSSDWTSPGRLRRWAPESFRSRKAIAFSACVRAVGKTSFFHCRKLLKPDGLFAATDLGPWGQNVVLAMWSSITRSNRVVILLPGRIDGFVSFLKSRMEAGQFRAIIDRKYILAEIADAYRYVETGQKVGIVVIDVAAAEESLPARGC